MSLLRSDANTHVVYNVGQFWADMLKSFALGKNMNLHNIVLNQFLPLVVLIWGLILPSSFIHLPCIKFSSTRAEKRLHAFECRTK